jgi:hypothetical protein
MDTSAGAARAAADRLLRSGFVEDPTFRTQGAAGHPIAVREPGGEHATAGWFVPVLIGDRLPGFFQFDANLTLLRFSRFPRPVAASSWTDANAVREIARATFPDVDSSGTPFLTYDQHPTRLVWAIPGNRTIYVAGDYAWLS